MRAITDRELEENKHERLVHLSTAITQWFSQFFLCWEHIIEADSSSSYVPFQQTPFPCQACDMLLGLKKKSLAAIHHHKTDKKNLQISCFHPEVATRYLTVLERQHLQ